MWNGCSRQITDFEYLLWLNLFSEKFENIPSFNLYIK